MVECEFQFFQWNFKRPFLPAIHWFPKATAGKSARDTFVVTVVRWAIAFQCDLEIVTVIEVLSPANEQLHGPSSQRLYMEKRKEILASRTHLNEIDLLRAGDRRAAGMDYVSSDYLVVLSRSEKLPTVRVWSTSLLMPLPTIPVPLLPGDENVIISLQQLLDQVYDDSRYERLLDCSAHVPAPPLNVENATWVQDQLVQ